MSDITASRAELQAPLHARRRAARSSWQLGRLLYLDPSESQRSKVELLHCPAKVVNGKEIAVFHEKEPDFL